jgi:hypothetical protein
LIITGNLEKTTKKMNRIKREEYGQKPLIGEQIMEIIERFAVIFLLIKR